VWALPLSAGLDRPWNLDPSVESLAAVLVLGVMSTTLAYIVYFRLVRTVGATFVSFVNYLIPPVGVGLGILVAGETPTPRAVLALFIILAGIAATRRA
jgi:drug/metabolite transporter (DMT)-like permease